MALEETWGWLTNRPGRALLKMLEDGLGGYNANGDYSETSKDFFIAPPEGVVYEVLGLNIFLTCGQISDKLAYGTIASGLNTGVRFFIKRGEYEQDLSPIGPVQNNQGLLMAGARMTRTGLDGGDVLHVFRFEFYHDYARTFSLFSSREESFRVRLNEDFSSLSTHCFSVNGIRRALHRDLQL